ncbi:MAG TPA: extracellular solute-binding protein [Candidatus Acidoferrum sp.]|jgi:trehalose/maltose transport system substrate-binding protein|nr:extracellular solute-binding protein [Candidatus Acidoferrum sp.]
MSRVLRRAERGRNRFRHLGVAAILLSAFLFSGCRKPAQPVTITFFDSDGRGVPGDHRMIPDAYLQEFTRETGIRVNDLPTPEDTGSKLDLVMNLLRSGAPSPDVYGVDTIWVGTMGEYLIDLQPYFASEISSEDRNIIDIYRIQGKVVAMPNQPLGMQVLVYRTDLLAKYGYKTPSRTWDELEKMAARIQAGERANGKKDFWGFVWSGAIATDSEQLTMEGLEWQAAEGGGHIIESDGKISVNNPNVIRAWERAAHWVGWISPPSVVSYTATDAENKFWVSGEAAFLLSHAIVYEIFAADKPFRDQGGVTSVPAGTSARVATIGGYALGISRFSAHRAEAVTFIQFLLRKGAEFRATHPEKPGRKVEYFEVPPLMREIYPWWYKTGESGGSEIVSRPSAVAGANYQAVSKAYTRALHSVLTQESTAPAAAAALENELARIMGNDTAQQGTGSH